MATPRHQLIDPEHPLHYHLVSRCVRKSWLCGKAPGTRRCYDHRKGWLTDRLFHLSRCFAVAIDAYAVMSNHFHLVVYYDPQDSYRWTDEEVADRWLMAFPPRAAVETPNDAKEVLKLHRSLLLTIPEKLLHARQTLGSLSMFMKHLKQPIAYLANREDQCSGHFFEGRFYSGALLDEGAVIAAMAYVDLNPVRARIVNDIGAYQAASGSERLAIAANNPERLARAVTPLVNGLLKERPAIRLSLDQYLNLIKQAGRDYVIGKTRDKQSRWFERISSLRKRQRAFGTTAELTMWKTHRGWSISGNPMPAI